MADCRQESVSGASTPVTERSAAQNRSPEDTLNAGVRMGMDWAISMARAGNLRLAALPFEKGELPRDQPIRPWKITRLAWRSWWRERTNRG